MKAMTACAKYFLAAGLALSFTHSAVAATGPEPASQAYPTKAIRVIVPFGTGSTTDTLTCIVGQKLVSLPLAEFDTLRTFALGDRP